MSFKALAEKYEASGGDIKNAVLKAAAAAAGEPGSDAGKAIYHRHFEAAMKDVIAAKDVMQQTLFEPRPLDVSDPLTRKVAALSLLIAAAALIVAIVAIAR